MNKNQLIRFVGFLLFAAFVSACGTPSTNNTERDVKSDVTNLEQELYSSKGMLDMDKADSMVDLYFEYVEEFPDDTLSVRYLFKAAELQMGMNKNLECINTLTKLQDNYPDCSIMPMVLHFKAFVYDDKFQDFDKARACLDELITKYPNDPLVPNAKAYREMIGKDPNEVFRQNDSLNN
jgi:TolA-binding protein